MERLAKLRAERVKTQDEIDRLAVEDAAERVGPWGSCKSLIAYNDEVDRQYRKTAFEPTTAWRQRCGKLSDWNGVETSPSMTTAEEMPSGRIRELIERSNPTEWEFCD